MLCVCACICVSIAKTEHTYCRGTTSKVVVGGVLRHVFVAIRDLGSEYLLGDCPFLDIS